MEAAERVDPLVSLPDEAAQRRFLRDAVHAADSLSLDELAEALKDKVIELQRADIQAALRTAGLIHYLAELTDNNCYRALGLRSEAQARLIGLGEIKQSLPLYDQAIALYRALDDAEGEATTQVTRIWALASLGRYDEALQAGHWAGDVLGQRGRWRVQAVLHNNLAAVYGRMGQDQQSLAMLEQARAAYRQLGVEGEPHLSHTELNRSILLRDLGRYQEAIDVSTAALDIAERYGQTAMVARIQQNQGINYFVLGRYNEALQLLHQARDTFSADGRLRDAILVELFISDCLLQLRRFPEVLEKSRQARELFAERGTRFEVAQSWLNEAMAHVGLEQWAEGQLALDEARRLFEEEGNISWIALTDLKRATFFLQQQAYENAYTTAVACTQDFEGHNLPLAAAQARLVAGQAAAAMGRAEEARRLAEQVLAFGGQADSPFLAYQAHALLGQLARAGGDPALALPAYDAAIHELERLQGRLMVEYRPNFIADKQLAYEDALLVSLELNRPEQALEYAERARARALLDLLAHRLNLGLEARSTTDAPLVEHLLTLRAERDRLYRRWESGEERPAGSDVLAQGGRVQEDVLAIEKQITALWHELLVRNADYARDAALWQVQTESPQPYLDKHTALLSYFFAGDKLTAFVVTADNIHSYQLPVMAGQISGWLQRFGLNLRSVPHSKPGQQAALVKNAQLVLHKLYALLFEPLAATLEPFKHLIIVPHGPLHYLPFHALYNGRHYLLEQHTISYLPGASFLRYSSTPEAAQERAKEHALFAGHSWDGRLPHALVEAEHLATLWGGKMILEDEVTQQTVREAAADCRLVHLATHGDFRPDNPLFSGLWLADGWLTTLDVFDLSLHASLVTLSACQTGRSVVGGGDELFGLMRAFLLAGARSLLLSLWPVADETTADLMATFYGRLATGEEKGQALRAGQLSFVRRDDFGRHPYFWAPFYLVGHAGLL